MNNEKLKLIFSSNYFVVPRALLKVFKIKTALMLCELYSEYQYWFGKGGVNKDNYFYSTIQNVQDNTGLTKHDQLVAVKELVEFGIIKMHLYGVPPKRFFRFEDSGISRLALKIGETIVSERKNDERPEPNPPGRQPNASTSPRPSSPPKGGWVF